MRWPATVFAALTAISLIVPVACAADEVSFTVEASRNKVYLGESVILSVRVRGMDKADVQPDLSAIKNCQVRSLGTRSESQQSISIINGRMTRTAVYGRLFQYEVTPQKTGNVLAGPIALKSKGNVIRKGGPVITVIGVEHQDLVLIDVTVSKQSVLIDEPFNVTVKLQLKALKGRFAQVDPLAPNAPPGLSIPYLDQTFENLIMPDSREILQPLLVQRGDQPGIYINDTTLRRDPFDSFFDFGPGRRSQKAKFSLQRRAVQHDGQPYWAYTLTTSYTPKDEGAHTFGPVLFKGPIVTSVTAGGRASTRDIFAVGAAAEVRVVPPPEADRPGSYVGVLGTDLRVTATLDAQTCNVGDPLKLTLSVSGAVNLDKLRPPPIWDQEDLTRLFRLYEDTLQTQRDGESVVYTMTIRPLMAGTIELPPLEAAYYNTVQDAYEVVRTAPIPLRVNEAEVLHIDDVLNLASEPSGGEGADQLTRRQSMAPITVDARGARREALMRRHVVLPIALAGPGCYLLSVLVGGLRKVQQRARRTRKPRGALAVAMHTVTRVQCDADTAIDARARALAAAMRQYVADRFEMAAGLTPDESADVLQKAGVEADTVSEYRQLLKDLVDLAFGGGADHSAIQVAERFGKVGSVLKAVDAQRRKPVQGHRALRSLLFFVLCFSLLSTGAQAVAGNRQAVFQWSHANQSMAAAVSAADFQTAAHQYRMMIDSDLRNGYLFYNHAVALLLSEQYDAAQRSILRAERRLGTTPEIQRVLQLALAGHQESMPALPWYRIPLFWHYGLPCALRATALACAFSLLWIVLVIRRYRKWIWTQSLAVALVCVTALLGSSVLASFYAEWKADRVSEMERAIVTEVTSLPGEGTP
ncbi:MAG: BatD family protein [Kiritimatiellae bacterium]|nr:BatD family protein [Kiritimatiellia bacterium]